MKVAQIMSTPLVSVTRDTKVPEIARLMQERNIGAVAVLNDDGTLAGLITESDFTGIGRCVPFSLERAPVIFGARAATAEELASIWADARRLSAHQVMTEKVYMTTEGAEVGAVVQEMLQRDLKHVPVMRGNRPIGMLARHDVLKLALETLSGGSAAPAS